LAKKSDAKNERAKGKLLKCKLSEPPRKSEAPGLNANNMKNKPTHQTSVPLDDVKRITEIKENDVKRKRISEIK